MRRPSEVSLCSSLEKYMDLVGIDLESWPGTQEDAERRFWL